MELRCDSRILHGIVEDDTIEFVCRSQRCGREPGVVVLHKFDLGTGLLLKTTKLREPKEVSNGSCR